MEKNFGNLSIYKQRLNKLLELIKKNINKDGSLLLIAGYENERTKFRQESSFYYYTGIEEPGVVLMADLDGKSKLLLPNFEQDRSVWMADCVTASPTCAKKYNLDEIAFLGNKIRGYQANLLFDESYCKNLIEQIKNLLSKNKFIFSLMPKSGAYLEQQVFVDRLSHFIPELKEKLIDVSKLVAGMRRTKERDEIELIYEAIDCTMSAHEAAATVIEPEKFESHVQASIEFIYTESGAIPAFPSIIAAGKNATVLHYNKNNQLMKNGDLVLVDIGAELNYYCADLTRTFPVSGEFTKRQKEIYNLVLQAQQYIADIAKPGFWINNPEQPEKSLQHLTKKFFDSRGDYGKYFTHGIGHFLGMDVHDVGDRSVPLQDGDVFTIEPGLYIPAEGIGIRIEDDYWMAGGKTMCLSEELPKEIEDIEAAMQFNPNEEEEETEEWQG
ncbi:aminopeptidase P N-terminal domain-containing protein [Candidatus Dependentiae bacterium]|nr:aminopeptidase P N-terminal domain-containing protein [Candidatus Dependentiae bacterium]